jgi:hypothetical protein
MLLYAQNQLAVVREDRVVPWIAPEYDRQAVNNAASMLFRDRFIEVEEDDGGFPIVPVIPDPYTVIGNWRSSHSFPLNTFKIGLAGKATAIDPEAVVAQRLKRLSSIADKLSRYPEMKLSQMQDIAGCRAIVSSVADVRDLVAVYKKSEIKHKLVHEDDYINNPKESGYRGVHLIYRYFSDRKQTYNGLKVEMQLRSLLQHAWATAVETVGTFIQQALKSSQGEAEWLRFFALMGTAIANREGTPAVPGTPDSATELKRDLRRYARKLDVENHLSVYADALSEPDRVGVQKGAHYFLLELDPWRKRVKITGYKSHELPQASRDYLDVERSSTVGTGKRDAVLVSVDSFAALKRAYPNYFLDTHRFIQAVRLAIK